eukprot:PhF_6_TR13645/c0_g1_i1/m.21883
MEADLSGMLGISLVEAKGLLDAAGGNAELAITLFYDGGVPPASGGASTTTEWKEPYPFWNVLWPQRSAVPASWSEQTFTNLTPQGGIIQNVNGSCGVLAVVQAYMWELKTCNPYDAIEVLLEAASNGSGAIVGLDGVSRSVKTTAQGILTVKDLVEVIVATKGEEAIRKETDEIPLIYGPHWLCSSSLMTLLLTGNAHGNFSAYEVTGTKRNFYPSTGRYPKLRPGILSSDEKASGVPLADDLKNTPSMIWILHSGDHFTTMRLKEDGRSFELFNGLPPGGPRHATVCIRDGDITTPSIAPEVHRETFRKTRPGYAEDIVQAQKTPGTGRYEFTSWTFEVIAAVDDPSVVGEWEDPRPGDFVLAPGRPIPGKPWRCCECYRQRYKTMCFGLNDPSDSSDPVCKVCGKQSSANGGTTVWMKYDELPSSMKSLAQKMYGPKVLTLLKSRWPSVDFDIGPLANPPSI